MPKRTAIVLFNLGGPDSLKSIQPFLFNLFNDGAIINIPQPFRYLLARRISSKRAPNTQEIFKKIGNKSPLVEHTKAQADTLEQALAPHGNYKAFVAMRYWHPRALENMPEIKQYDKVILLPLYPQYSGTTTLSSVEEWQSLASKFKYNGTITTIGCYYKHPGFIRAYVDLLYKSYQEALKLGKDIKILFSAHGLPQKMVDAGDPYQWQITDSAKNIMKELGIDLDYEVCYQSKVGPLKWLEPSTEISVLRAARKNKIIILLPISFVSEHSETLVELDIEYAELAKEHGAKGFIRVPTVGTHPEFIKGLADMCTGGNNYADKQKCSQGFKCFCQAY